MLLSERLKSLELELADLKSDEIETVTDQEMEWYDTTFWQKKVYLKHVYLKNPTVFNATFQLRVEPNSFVLLNDIMSGIVSRNESLRTSFAIVNGEIKQRIYPFEAGHNTIHLQDFKQVALSEKDVSGIIHDHNLTNFNLSTGPIFKATLFELENYCFFIFTIHQINFEGYSLQLMKNEIVNCLKGIVKDIVPSLQMKDVAALLEDSKLESSRNYWLKEFEKPLDPAYMAADYPYPIEKSKNISYQENLIQQSYASCHDFLTEEQRKLLIGVVPTVKVEPATKVVFTLSEEENRSIERKAAEEKVSVFTIVLTAMSIVMHNMSNHQEDIVIGSIGSFRNKKGLINTIGYLSNFILYRINLGSDLSIKELLQEVRRKIHHAQDHHIFPYEKVLEILDKPHEHVNNLLIDFISLEQPLDFQIEGYRVEEKKDWADFDINCIVAKYSNGFYIECFYNKNMYVQETIFLFLNNFKEVLQQISSGEALNVKELIHEHFQIKNYR